MSRAKLNSLRMAAKGLIGDESPGPVIEEGAVQLFLFFVDIGQLSQADVTRLKGSFANVDLASAKKIHQVNRL